MNQKRKTPRKLLQRQMAQQCDVTRFELLRKFWPKVFKLKKPPRPLICGIHQDMIDELRARGIPYFHVLKELKAYVTRDAYYECLIDNNTRYDLNAVGVAAVTAEEKKQVRLKIPAKKTKQQLKKEAAKRHEKELAVIREQKELRRQLHQERLANLNMSPLAVERRERARLKRARKRWAKLAANGLAS